MSGCSIPFSSWCKQISCDRFRCFCVRLECIFIHGFLQIYEKRQNAYHSIFTHCFPVLSIDFSCFFFLFFVHDRIHTIFRFQLTNRSDYDKISTSMNLRRRLAKSAVFASPDIESKGEFLYGKGKRDHRIWCWCGGRKIHLPLRSGSGQLFLSEIIPERKNPVLYRRWGRCRVPRSSKWKSRTFKQC